MANFSENYYLRDYYFRHKQVPTLSMITNKMTPSLAAIYFKSMRPRVKVLAGLEPSLKGGGSDWYVPPEELLRGRAVLKPVKKEVISKLNHQGVATIGTTVFQKHRKDMDLEIEQAILNSDINWRNSITATTRRLWDDLVAAAIQKNSDHIMKDFNEFTYLYRQSLGKIEILFHNSAVTEIKSIKENAIHEMKNKYATALEHQATLLYDKYEKKLTEEIPRLKIDFIEKLETNRTAVFAKIHDLKVDKHMAVEKLRQCLECQNLACGIYVALKEREECFKETEELKRKHKKKIKSMTHTILNKDLEIHLKEETEKKQQDFVKIWQKKVCRVVKSFQMFVLYCLNTLPEHSEFFINMEKLMLLQVDEALTDPTAASIIELETEKFHTPIPRPEPFYLFCDKGYKPKMEQDLCPKHSGTSSASGLLPVMIINKQCLYAACDNFDQFTNKIKEYIYGSRGDDADFEDDLVYEHFVPVRYGSSQRLLEIKLESSLFQILQQEMENVQTEEGIVPIKCRDCGLSWCYCRPRPATLRVDASEKTKLAPSSITSSTASHHKLQSMDRSMELVHEREPKWESYCRYVEPKKCSCTKTAKKHLTEHLPTYMRQMRYEPSALPNYEMCSVSKLKTLVKKARKAPLASVEFLAKTKDVATQFLDPEFDILCTCFSNAEESRFPIDPTKLAFTGTYTIEGTSHLTERSSSFAISRAISLRNLLQEFPEIKEIFTRKECAFE